MAASKPIMEGLQVSYIEAYTPVTAQITSTYLANRPLEFAFFMTSADADVVIQCYGGNVATVSVRGGIVYPVAVKQIRSVSAGVVYILHNGK